MKLYKNLYECNIHVNENSQRHVSFLLGITVLPLCIMELAKLCRLLASANAA